MPVPPRALFDWHARPGAFERLSPAWQGARVVSRTGGITNGSRVEVEVPQLGGLVHQRLLVEHRDYVEGERFTDVQLSGPFARWAHTHSMLPGPDGTSILEDRIDYALPLHPLGELVAGWFVTGELERLFDFRHARTRDDLLRHAQYADQPRRTVAITGGTGMIGRALTALLTTGGHTVKWITRRPDAARGDIGWDPDAGRLDPAALAGVDAVVHLAGANVGERWTDAHKREIRQSREAGTRTLVQAMLMASVAPECLISGSAVGYYGDGGAKVIDEEASKGAGFLADVCEVWEDEARKAEAAGVRVVIARTGVVLSPAGGALAKMLPAFRLGAGGPMGSGQQWMSWISLDDEVGALHALLMDRSCRGTFNLTGPTPVTNAEFGSTLGRVLHRPAFVPVPAFALTALFGEMAQSTVLDGQRVVPARLQATGYQFRHATLEAALRFELGG
ncbi:MAG: TIGR01777 family oxidoreductase [Gemmatimonadaceae bacterium]|nr:TIGR01777 family oxidoreductase [Gemmatimonadaceae bacterium]